MLDAVGEMCRWNRRQQRKSRAVVGGGIGRKTMIGMLLATMSRRRALALRPPPSETPVRRMLQGNNNVTADAGGGSSSIDLESCIAALNASDADSDGYLSQDEYLAFVQYSANGTLDANVYGMPITQFSMLPREYVSTYNFLACGSPSFGCTTGINIGDEMSGGVVFWSELCKQYHVVGEPAASAPPTAKPAAGGGGRACEGCGGR